VPGGTAGPRRAKKIPEGHVLLLPEPLNLIKNSAITSLAYYLEL